MTAPADTLDRPAAHVVAAVRRAALERRPTAPRVKPLDPLLIVGIALAVGIAAARGIAWWSHAHPRR